MKPRPNHAAIVCCVGMLIASGLPMGSSTENGGDILSAVLEPLRMIHREAVAQETSEVTPSHVYQATSNLISEIDILRDAMGVSVYPIEAEAQEDRAPIHVYAKSLEVLEKISASQKRLGMAPARIAQIPVKDIRAKDVYSSVQNCLVEVRRIKEQLVIEDEIVPAPFEGGKTPSAVYEHLGDASFLLDGLVGHPTDPNDVHTHLVYLHDEMELIAAKLKVALELDPPVVEGKKRMKEVAQQVLRATFKIINLQTRLGMDASGVPADHSGAGVSGGGLRGHQHPAGGDGADQGASRYSVAAHGTCPIAEQEAEGLVRSGSALHQQPERPGKGGRRLHELGSRPRISRRTGGCMMEPPHRDPWKLQPRR